MHKVDAAEDNKNQGVALRDMMHVLTSLGHIHVDHPTVVHGPVD